MKTRGGERPGAGRPKKGANKVLQKKTDRCVTCRHCEHKWIPRRDGNPCPRCQRRDWKKPGRPRGSGDRATAEQKEHVSKMARQHTEAALNALLKICETGSNERAVVAAATAILNRGHGLPPQSQKIEWGGEAAMRIPIEFIDLCMAQK